MDDLISRAAAIAEIEEYIEEYSELETETGYHNLKWCAMEEAKDVLSMLPAVSAVQVIRCRDCKHWCRCDDGISGTCGALGGLWDENEFCSDGERRDSE